MYNKRIVWIFLLMDSFFQKTGKQYFYTNMCTVYLVKFLKEIETLCKFQDLNRAVYLLILLAVLLKNDVKFTWYLHTVNCQSVNEEFEHWFKEL